MATSVKSDPLTKSRGHFAEFPYLSRRRDDFNPIVIEPYIAPASIRVFLLANDQIEHMPSDRCMPITSHITTRPAAPVEPSVAARALRRARGNRIPHRKATKPAAT